MPRGFTLAEANAFRGLPTPAPAPVQAPASNMVPIYKPMSDRQKDYNALHGLSTTPEIVGYSVDLGNGQFGNYDANKNFLGNVSDNKGGFATQFLQNNGENLLNAGLLVGGAALLGGANLGSDVLSNIFGGSSTAADIAASDLAAYPTAGIVGDIPVAAGAANGIAAVGPAITAETPTLTPLSEIGSPTAAPAPVTTTPVSQLPAYDQYIPPEAVSAPPYVPPVVTPPGAPVATTPISQLPAYDTYVPPEAVSAPPSIPAYDQYVPPESVSAPSSVSSNVSPGLLKQLTDATGLTGTQLAALLSGGISAINSGNISSAIGAGVDAQAAANAQSQGVLKDVYNTQLGFQQPYQAAGSNAINTLSASQPYLTHQFDATDLQKGLAPNYDFMLQQGQMANQRAANVGGGALSGNTLQGLQNYTQNYAGNAYQNAFNNYQTQRGNIYNSLAGIAGIGQTANTGAGAAAQNYGKGTVDLNTGLAGVRAAGMLGQAQSNAQGASAIGNATWLASLLNPKP